MEREWLEVLLPRQTLEEVLGEELSKQYRLHWGEDCVYMPVSNGAECLCTCGTVNPVGEVCTTCGRLPAIPGRQELEMLRAEAAERLEQEEACRAKKEAERLRQEAELQKRKRRRWGKLCAAVVGVLAVGAAAMWAVFRFAVPAYHYSRALDALEQKNYQLAHREFKRAGEYKDAPDYLSRFYTPVLTVRTEGPGLRSFREYTYDSAGRVIKEMGEQFTQDKQGNVVTDSRWVYERAYDAEGRIVVYQDGYGKREYFYDQRGDLYWAEVYTAGGELKTSYTFARWYDAEDRLAELEVHYMEHSQPSGSYILTDRYAYDEAGRMVWQETTMDDSAKANAGYVTTTRWRYDAKGRQVEKTVEKKGAGTDFGDMTEEGYWTYDEAGNLLTHTRKTDYAQDPASDVERKEIHTYDSRGLLTELLIEYHFPQDTRRDYKATIAQEYDKAGRCVRTSQVVEYESPERQKGLAHSRTEEITYDLWGRPVKTVRTTKYAQPRNNYVGTETVDYGPDGVQKTVRAVVEQNGKVTEDVEVYGENGLLSSVVYEHEDGDTRQDFTYAYFYYPEGEIPSWDFVDPIAQWTPIQLYGVGA